MNEPKQKSDDLKLIEEHLAALSEHFDGVQIFATRHEQGQHDGTVNIQIGCGNWYARYGHIKAWTIRQDEMLRVELREEREEDK